MSSTTTPPPGEYTGSPYGYIPTEGVCITFIVLFSLSALLHTAQAIKWRTWYMLPTMVIGCIGETVGWSGRLWSSRSPPLMDPFLMQITSTIISPTFMSAANFTILGLIIRRLGVQYSRLSPAWYLIIFVTLDVAALTVQAIGGASASGAASRGENADAGARIMLWGIIVQMIALTAYVILGADFIRAYHFNKPVRALPKESVDTLQEKESHSSVNRNTRIMLVGLVINSVFLFIRTIYRTIELNEGWSGAIITNQLLFNVLDGMQIVCATYTFNILHPGYLLKVPQTDAPKDSA